MTWPGAYEHQALLHTADNLVGELLDLGRRLNHLDDTTHWQHQEFADRVRNLGLYLRSAVLVACEDIYAPAFASLRTALEHMLVDHLVFNGQRLIRFADGVDDETWAEWQRQRATGERFAEVLSWTRRKTTVEFVTEGRRSQPDEDGTFYVLGPHYFLLHQYQPFLGPASAQDEFDDGISDIQDRRRFAKENELVYRTYLSWSSIRRNLLLNDFADEIAVSRIEVHYRFLSAFVHPLANTSEVIYGRNSTNVPQYDHYSSELILLYCIVIAVEELRHFREMAQRRPLVGINGWSDLAMLCDGAWQLASHLWWPGQLAHAFDRVQEANKRGFRAQINDPATRGPVPVPMSIPETEIRYYPDPMRRLIELHRGFGELTTGLVYWSPWPRDDVRFR